VWGELPGVGRTILSIDNATSSSLKSVQQKITRGKSFGEGAIDRRAMLTKQTRTAEHRREREDNQGYPQSSRGEAAPRRYAHRRHSLPPLEMRRPSCQQQNLPKIFSLVEVGGEGEARPACVLLRVSLFPHDTTPPQVRDRNPTLMVCCRAGFCGSRIPLDRFEIHCTLLKIMSHKSAWRVNSFLRDLEKRETLYTSTPLSGETHEVETGFHDANGALCERVRYVCGSAVTSN
jgi:hypothetical protein